jgi:hypothetical protein
VAAGDPASDASKQPSPSGGRINVGAYGNTPEATTAGPVGILLVESGGSTGVSVGGAADSYSVVLTAAPSSDVVVTLSHDNPLTLSTSQLTFTPTNWSAPQAVSVKQIAPPGISGNYSVTIHHAVTGADARYNGLSVRDLIVAVAGVGGSTLATATLTLGGLTFTYDGNPHAATVTTNPPGLAGVSVSYAQNGVPVPAPVAAGTYTVTATLTNPNYRATPVQGTLTILRATPVIQWSRPAPLIAGQALDASRLNATASVPGTFVYTPPLGTVLNVGNNQPLSVSFTPADSNDYGPVVASTTIDVLPVGTAIIQFAAATIPADVTAGSVTVGLTRTGSPGPAASVVLSSPGGFGVAAFQTTVTFAPGVSSVTVPIPLIDNGQVGVTESHVPLALSNASTGAALGSPDSAELVVRGRTTPAPLVTVTSVGVVKVQVTSGKRRKTVSAVQVRFSGAVTGADATASYTLVTGKTTRVHRQPIAQFNRLVPLSSARWDPTSSTALLIPIKKLRAGQPLELRITATSLTDRWGRPLDGDRNGQPGGDYIVVVQGKGSTG